MKNIEIYSEKLSDIYSKFDEEGDCIHDLWKGEDSALLVSKYEEVTIRFKNIVKELGNLGF